MPVTRINWQCFAKIAYKGISVLPPDLNCSESSFSVEKQDSGNWAIRYALGAVRNVGAEAMEKLVAIRKEGGYLPLWMTWPDVCRAREINASSRIW